MHEASVGRQETVTGWVSGLRLPHRPTPCSFELHYLEYYVVGRSSESADPTVTKMALGVHSSVATDWTELSTGREFADGDHFGGLVDIDGKVTDRDGTRVLEGDRRSSTGGPAKGAVPGGTA